MKRFALALFVAAAALAATTTRAETHVRIGVNLGVPVYTPPPAVVYAPAPVVVAPEPACPPPASVQYVPAPVQYVPARGHWEDVAVKTWVPERWVMSRDRWGRAVRVCEPGYYTYRTERVWVDGRDHGRHNGYAYGYNR